MSRVRVGVLRGGPSSEYEVSLKTGANVLKHLDRERYEPVDVLIDRAGTWHVGGMEIEPSHAHQHFDVAMNAMHGEYGEDGTVQRLLDAFGIPYTGSGTVSSAVAMNKDLAKRAFRMRGLPTLAHRVITVTNNLKDEIRETFTTVPPPYIVKPVFLGSSVGIARASYLHDLPQAIAKAFESADEVMVEHFAEGREATVGVIEHFRGQPYYATLPIEIVPPSGSDFFDYDAKYGGESDEICPAPFDPAVNGELERLAIEAHQAVGARHYSRSDFIVTPRSIYILEINTLPGLTDASLLPKSLAAAGSSTGEFLDHLLSLTHP